jgi:hypothetical protein
LEDRSPNVVTELVRSGFLALVFALIEGLGLSQIGVRALHEIVLGLLTAEAVGLALYRRIDGAIRLYVFLIGEAPGTHIGKLACHGIGCGGKSKYECDRECGRGVTFRHGWISYEEVV